MSQPNETRGGQIAIRGFLVQTLIALLDITKVEPPFQSVTLEPMIGDDQFDFLWTDAQGQSHAVQVKSTENSFTKADVTRWADKLQAARTNEQCRLILVGNIPPALVKLKKSGKVIIESKNLDLEAFIEQAAHRIAAFLEREKLDAGTAAHRVLLVKALVYFLQHHSTTARTISRDEFIIEIRQWIGSVPLRGVPVQLKHFDVIKYAPAELIGREADTQLLNDAWSKVQSQAAQRPHVMTFVAMGGEGKTSLVAKWAAELAAQDWPGCEAAFAWSFYSQGTRDQVAASSDLFLNEALTFFGDEAMARSAQGAYDKGQRLARLVGERRALLILDGLEPLQYPPGPPLDGKLKDEGIAALLKGLAAQSCGLCIVTTRYSQPDLKAFWQTTAPQHALLRLSRAAGVHLLKKLEVKGSELRNIPLKDGDEKREKVNEFEKLVEDVKGHALTLNLLGTYLRDAHAGDIRRRDRIKLAEADAEEQGGHAFRVMDAYVQSFESGGKTDEDNAKGRRALALLQLLGLFDRPATADCLRALWEGAPIIGLTEPLFTTETKGADLKQTHQPIREAQRNLSLKRLEDARLLTVNRDAAGTLLALDAHPLVREYFAERVRDEQPEAWRAAHKRLYEHFCATTQEGDAPTLEALQPLYQAVAHGCQASLQQEACEKVYRDRILRGAHFNGGFYSTKKLGAYGSDLSAVTCFFETLWNRVSPTLYETDQAWLLNEAAFCLRALGRLSESLEPMQIGAEMRIKQEDWPNAAQSVLNLSELQLTLGMVGSALQNAERSVQYADRSDDSFHRISKRAAYADALHQSGNYAEAEAYFRQSEQILIDDQTDYPLLDSLQGFRYCNLLLAQAERTAFSNTDFELQMAELAETCRAVSKRAAQTLDWSVNRFDSDILSIALNRLTIGRAALYEAILTNSVFHLPPSTLNQTVSEIRCAGAVEFLVQGLLTRAWLRHLSGARTGFDSAQSDLDEAWDIATRGSMKLHLADIHLYRARLFGRGQAAEPYPWESAAADLAAAERLINECGYHRRDAELADAQCAIDEQVEVES